MEETHRGYIVLDGELHRHRLYGDGTIVKTEDVNGDAPYIEGTGYPVYQFWSMAEDGWSIEEILGRYNRDTQQVTEGQVEKALQYAQHHEEEMKALMRDKERVERALRERSDADTPRPVYYQAADEDPLDVDLEYSFDVF